MKYAKYILICLCIVLSLLLTMELYKSYSADFEGYDHFIMELSEEDLEAQLEKIAHILDQNELGYFIVNEIAQDSSRVKIELYCSSDEVKQKLQRKDRRAEGIYNSLFYGGVTVSYGENFTAFAEAIHTSGTAYVCLAFATPNVAELDYQAEYLAENMIKGESAISYLLLIELIWVLTSFWILLLSMVDSYAYQKTLFIQLAYGYEKKVLILKRLCEEVAFLAFAFFVPILILHSFLPFNIVTGMWWLFAFAVLMLDGAILLYPFWNFNCRAALGRGQHADSILTACYGVRIVLLVVSILLSAVAVRQISIYISCQSLNEVFLKYSGYAHVQAEQLNAALEEESVHREQIMVLRAKTVIPTVDGANCEVFVANAQAVALLEGIIPEITRVSEDKIRIFFPDHMKPEDLEEFGKDLMTAFAVAFDDKAEVEYAYYPADATLSFLYIRAKTENCTVVNEDLTICYAENPIVIYYAGDSADCYYYSEGFVQILSEEMGDFKDYIDIYKSYQESISMYRIQCLIWGSVAIIFLGLLHLLRSMILRLEHSINAMELCLKKIYGMPLLVRYDRMMVGTFLSYIVGIIISIILLDKVGGVPLWSIFLALLILFVGDMTLTILEIYRWEKTHIMKILKGGCL